MLLDGEPVAFRDTREAIDSGVAMIHQELNLVPELSVYENIFLGREHKTRLGTLDRGAMRRAAEALMSTLGLDIDTNRAIERLRVSQRQLVEIAKALSLDTRSSSWTSRPRRSATARSSTSSTSSAACASTTWRSSTSRTASTRSTPSPTASRCCGTGASSGRRTRARRPAATLISMMVGRDLEVLYPKAQVELGRRGPARRGADATRRIATRSSTTCR